MRKTARGGKRQDDTELERHRYPRTRGIPGGKQDPARRTRSGCRQVRVGTSEALAGFRNEALP
jgi:hypothetical protein